MKKSSVFSLTLVVVLLASLLGSVSAPRTVHATPASDGCWYYKEPMPTERWGLAATELGGEIYVLGGRDGEEQRYDVVEKYDPAGDSWTTMAPMPTKRAWLVAATALDQDSNSKIYAIGGSNSLVKFNVVEAYDPVTNNWANRASMPTARDDAAIGVVNNKIYVMGGWNGGALDNVEVYDPVANTWTIKASMPYSTAMGTAAVVDNKIYVMGGLNGSGSLSTVYEYDPEAFGGFGNWTPKASMPIPRSRLTSAAVGGKIYVFGGYNNAQGRLDDVHVYDPLTNSWSAMNWMPTARADLAAGAVGDNVYVVGGRRGWDGTIVPFNEMIDLSCSNNPPDAPFGPGPGNGFTNRPRDVALSWSGNDPDMDSMTYDVYFGEDEDPGPGANTTTPPLVSGGQSGTSYDPPGTLKPSTTYFWYIVATDSNGAVTSGPRWNFTTGGGPYIQVEKTADPPIVGEPGGTVQFTVQVTNPKAGPLTLTGIEDDVYGDLNGQGDCSVPESLGGFSMFSCSFDGAVAGNAGDVVMNTVTVTATDALDQIAEGVASASVAITDTVPTVLVIKSADPQELEEPGGSVAFNVQVSNTSSETLTLTSLVDDVFGDLDEQENCSVPQTIDAGARYECAFSAEISGDAGFTHTDIVTATVEDDESNPTEGWDDAVVQITDALPTATVLKTAAPSSLPEPGGTVTFTLVLTNTSAETITVETLFDSAYGDLNGHGDCALPQESLAPDLAYQCTFTGTVAGEAGVTHTNTVTATILDDEDNLVQVSGDATVEIVEGERLLFLPLVSRGSDNGNAAAQSGGLFRDLVGVVLSTLKVGAAAGRSF
jgi:N-acetylneuraminic acid mutarotase